MALALPLVYPPLPPPSALPKVPVRKSMRPATPQCSLSGAWNTDDSFFAFTRVAQYRDVMVANGDAGKQIWFTEFGWSTHTNPVGTKNWLLGVSEATQAAYVGKTAQLVAERFPYVQKLYVYNDRDANSRDPQFNNFGVFRLDYSAKPVLGTISTINHTV